MMRAGLIGAVLTHIALTIMLTLENRQARGGAYEILGDFGETSFAKKTMVYTGFLIFFFLFLHLADYTFADKTGPASDVVSRSSGETVNLGLFGLVWNSFLNPLRAAAYILAVCCVGLHVSHGIESFCQTLGAKPEGYMPIIRRVSVGVGILTAVGFSAIPLYVWIRHFTMGLGV
jgi:succinate dehydrogenase / fumarate reductase cytochrome b subunit